MKIPLHSTVDYQLKLMVPKYSLSIHIFVRERYTFYIPCKVSVFSQNPVYCFLQNHNSWLKHMRVLLFKYCKYILVLQIRICSLLIAIQFCTSDSLNPYSTRLLYKVSILLESSFPLFSLALHQLPRNVINFIWNIKGLCIFFQNHLSPSVVVNLTMKSELEDKIPQTC